MTMQKCKDGWIECSEDNPCERHKEYWDRYLSRGPIIPMQNLAECPWCEEEYDLTPETEKIHLASCRVYQSLPTAEVSPEGKQFVRLPSCEHILVERVRVH